MPTITDANANNLRDIRRSCFMNWLNRSNAQSRAVIRGIGKTYGQGFQNGKGNVRPGDAAVLYGCIDAYCRTGWAAKPASGLPTGSGPETARRRQRGGAAQWCPPARASRNALAQPFAW